MRDELLAITPEEIILNTQPDKNLKEITKRIFKFLSWFGCSGHSACDYLAEISSSDAHLIAEIIPQVPDGETVQRIGQFIRRKKITHF